MADAVAVVAPSTWTETFGLVVVEAMSAGVPAVVAAHGGPADLVEDGVTGVHHRPFDADSLADALRRVLPADRNRALGTAARRHYEHEFTSDRALNALLDGYRRALHHVGPHSAQNPLSEKPPNSRRSVGPRRARNR